MFSREDNKQNKMKMTLTELLHVVENPEGRVRAIQKAQQAGLVVHEKLRKEFLSNVDSIKGERWLSGDSPTLKFNFFNSRKDYQNAFAVSEQHPKLLPEAITIAREIGDQQTEEKLYRQLLEVAKQKDYPVELKIKAFEFIIKKDDLETAIACYGFQPDFGEMLTARHDGPVPDLRRYIYSRAEKDKDIGLARRFAPSGEDVVQLFFKESFPNINYKEYCYAIGTSPDRCLEEQFNSYWRFRTIEEEKEGLKWDSRPKVSRTILKSPRRISFFKAMEEYANQYVTDNPEKKVDNWGKNIWLYIAQNCFAENDQRLRCYEKAESWASATVFARKIGDNRADEFAQKAINYSLSRRDGVTAIQRAFNWFGIDQAIDVYKKAVSDAVKWHDDEVRSFGTYMLKASDYVRSIVQCAADIAVKNGRYDDAIGFCLDNEGKSKDYRYREEAAEIAFAKGDQQLALKIGENIFRMYEASCSFSECADFADRIGLREKAMAYRNLASALSGSKENQLPKC